jgi:hypothetical protein
MASATLARSARACGRLGAGRPLFSAVYNLAYYRGMADELGGADRLLRLFDGADVATLLLQASVR